MKAWHLCPAEMRRWYSDRPPGEGGIRRPIVIGEPIVHAKRPRLGVEGLHAAPRLVDALTYGKGAIICRVEIDGEVIDGGDRLAGTRRALLWHLTSRQSLDIWREFAEWCAGLSGGACADIYSGGDGWWTKARRCALHSMREQVAAGVPYRIVKRRQNDKLAARVVAERANNGD